MQVLLNAATSTGTGLIKVTVAWWYCGAPPCTTAVDGTTWSSTFGLTMQRAGFNVYPNAASMSIVHTIPMDWWTWAWTTDQAGSLHAPLGKPIGGNQANAVVPYGTTPSRGDDYYTPAGTKRRMANQHSTSTRPASSTWATRARTTASCGRSRSRTYPVKNKKKLVLVAGGGGGGCGGIQLAAEIAKVKLDKKKDIRDKGEAADTTTTD